MNTEPSPRPWRVEENVVGWSSFIVDANGNGVAACWRTARGDDEKERQYNEANAALIVDAVNERDRLAADEDRYRTDNVRLRDLVRRLSSHLANYLTSESENDLLREARAALGEDAP